VAVRSESHLRSLVPLPETIKCCNVSLTAMSSFINIARSLAFVSGLLAVILVGQEFWSSIEEPQSIITRTLFAVAITVIGVVMATVAGVIVERFMAVIIRVHSLMKRWNLQKQGAEPLSPSFYGLFPNNLFGRLDRKGLRKEMKKLHKVGEKSDD